MISATVHPVMSKHTETLALEGCLRMRTKQLEAIGIGYRYHKENLVYATVDASGK